MLRNVFNKSSARVTLTIDDTLIEADQDDTVASAILGAGLEWVRLNPANGMKQSIYCAMGSCQVCLVYIEGIGSVPACQMRVSEAMRVRRA